jgi:hypothetical protein
VRDERRREVLLTLQSAIGQVGAPALALELARVKQDLLRMWLEP